MRKVHVGSIIYNYCINIKCFKSIRCLYSCMKPFKSIKPMKPKFNVTILSSLLFCLTTSFVPADPGVTASEQDNPKVQNAPQAKPAATSSGVIFAQERIIPLAKRIGHYDKTKQREYKGVHAGAGSVTYQTLQPGNTIQDLVFMHCGPINPKSGIGNHFHSNADEMFFIIDGEAEFTINGQTALIKGPAGVPLKAGNSHAIYNPTDKPVNWLNFQVRCHDIDNPYPAGARGSYNYASDPYSGNFDLGDTRVGTQLVPVPTFMNTKTMTKDLMRPIAHMDGGKDTVYYRRALGASSFASNWAFFDHIIIPPKASVGRHLHKGVEEIYLVIKGKGRISVNYEMSDIVWGDAVPIYAGEIHSIENTSNEPLELVVYGVALEKGKLDEMVVPLNMTKLQMFFEVASEKCEAFELNYSDTYIPALRQQIGYLGSKLDRIYPNDVSKSISAAATKYNYQMELMFDTEEHRQMWTKTQIHTDAWAKTSGMAKSYQWNGYDVVGMDQVSDPIGSRSITTEKR
jgi:mannose-6-phosphate isomerase-like protein (cupin superfamily)